MKVLSLFDGISCARVALDRAGVPVELYWAVEIDKYATQISQKNYPDIVRTSDVKSFIGEPNTFDLLIGGSPCQDLSIAKKDRKGLDGERSGLFWEYVRILKEVKPKYFILENVNSMPKEAKELISETLGVEPVMINASLVSAQNRKRLFWVGRRVDDKYVQIEIPQPEDKGIKISDVIETKVDEVYQYRRTYYRRNISGKSPTITANMGTGGNNVPYAISASVRGRYLINGKRKDILGAKTKQYLELGNEKAHTLTSVDKDSLVVDGKNLRKFTPIECERLQCLPDNYTEGVSNTQRYKALGNAFNVDVVAHILSFISK